MKLSISNIGWSAENDTDMYRYLNTVGFNGLEIAPTRIFHEAPYDKLEDAKEFAEMLMSKYHLTIPSMQSIWFGKSQKVFGSEADRVELIEYTKKAFDFAEVIGCKNLVFGCPRNRVVNSPEDYAIAIEFFRDLGEYALAHAAVLAMEPNPPIYNTNFINRTEDAFQIVRDVDCSGFLVNVDFGTMIQNEESLELIVQNQPLINHIHISEPGLAQIEERQLHKELMSILVSGGYDKFVSIEMKNLNDLGIVKDTISYVWEVFG